MIAAVSTEVALQCDSPWSAHPVRVHRPGAAGALLPPTAIARVNQPQPDGTLMKALARAWRWQKLLDDNVYTSVTEIAEAELIGGRFAPVGRR